MKKLPLLLVLALVLVSNICRSHAQEIDHTNLKDTEQCFNCHGREDLLTEKDDKKISLYVDRDRYDRSVHGKLPCISCHDFEESSEYGEALKENVSEKCGNCHTGTRSHYQRSIHEEADQGPNCVDCHGAHEITLVDHAMSPVNGKNQHQSCGKCHQKAAAQFKESFHGKAVVLGSKKSPSCADCHGAHKILSSDHPAALTSERRTPTLCTKCHGGDALGVNAVEHYTLEPQGFGAPMYWIKKIFMWLILLVVGFFLIHILLDLAHKLRTRRS